LVSSVAVCSRPRLQKSCLLGAQALQLKQERPPEVHAALDRRVPGCLDHAQAGQKRGLQVVNLAGHQLDPLVRPRDPLLDEHNVGVRVRGLVRTCVRARYRRMVEAAEGQGRADARVKRPPRNARRLRARARSPPWDEVGARQSTSAADDEQNWRDPHRLSDQGSWEIFPLELSYRTQLPDSATDPLSDSAIGRIGPIDCLLPNATGAVPLMNSILLANLGIGCIPMNCQFARCTVPELMRSIMRATPFL
jgi:hypothetical protein